MEKCILEYSGSEQGRVATCCVYGNEILSYMKDLEVLDYLIASELLKKIFVPLP